MKHTSTFVTRERPRIRVLEERLLAGLELVDKIKELCPDCLVVLAGGLVRDYWFETTVGFNTGGKGDIDILVAPPCGNMEAEYQAHRLTENQAYDLAECHDVKLKFHEYGGDPSATGNTQNRSVLGCKYKGHPVDIIIRNQIHTSIPEVIEGFDSPINHFYVDPETYKIIIGYDPYVEELAYNLDIGSEARKERFAMMHSKLREHLRNSENPYAWAAVLGE